VSGGALTVPVSSTILTKVEPPRSPKRGPGFRRPGILSGLGGWLRR
jgi:hypothetical protein